MTTTSDTGSTDPDHIAFDRTIDWVIASLLGIVGVLIGLGGAALYFGVTHASIADIFQNAEFHSDVLTEARAIDVLTAFGQWGGVGLMVAGGLVVLLGIGLVVAHSRARSHGRRTPVWILGIGGAIIGTVLGFVPFSPVFGGAVAGYLDPNPGASGLGSGTLAGVFVSLPFLVVAGIASVGVLISVPGGVGVVVAVFLVLVTGFSLVYFVALSAFGGYLGGLVRTR